MWDPNQETNIQRLERTQRHAARFMTGNYDRQASVSEILNKIELPTLRDRRAATKVTTFFKGIKGSWPFQHPTSSRPKDALEATSRNTSSCTVALASPAPPSTRTQFSSGTPSRKRWQLPRRWSHSNPDSSATPFAPNNLQTPLPLPLFY